MKNDEFLDLGGLGPFPKEQARSADQQKWYSNVWAMKPDAFRTKSSFFLCQNDVLADQNIVLVDQNVVLFHQNDVLVGLRMAMTDSGV